MLKKPNLITAFLGLATFVFFVSCCGCLVEQNIANSKRNKELRRLHEIHVEKTIQECINKPLIKVEKEYKKIIKNSLSSLFPIILLAHMLK